MALDPIQASRFTLSSLPPDKQAMAIEIGRAISGSVLKGLLHRMDPALVAISPEMSGIEAAAAVEAHNIPPEDFEMLRARLAVIKSDDATVAALTGMNLSALRLAGAVKTPPKKIYIKPPAPAKPPKYKRLDLNVRALHCVDETNPEVGSDSMILGATRVGASGNVDYSKAIVAGSYDDGTRIVFGGEIPFGSVSLLTTNTWPKTFYWIFQLIESDSDDKAVAGALTKVFSIVASAAASAFLGGGAGIVAGGIVNSLGEMIAKLIDDDVFPPCGTCIKLDGEDEFGPAAYRDEHTADIVGHGGRYRIGYRLRLA